MGDRARPGMASADDGDEILFQLIAGVVLTLRCILVFCLELGGGFGVADVERGVRLFGSFEWADAFEAMPVALMEHGILHAGFLFALLNPRIHPAAQGV